MNLKQLIINQLKQKKKERIMITETEKKELTANAAKACKWFKIEVSISIFGKVIIHWVYPPQKGE